MYMCYSLLFSLHIIHYYNAADDVPIYGGTYSTHNNTCIYNLIGMSV